MADTVDSIVQLSGKRKYIIRLTNISDGTGESAVTKVDKSTLTTLAGVEPTYLAIVSAQWSIQGFSSVRLLWDNTTDDEALIMATGNGYRCFEPPLHPASASAQTGDLLLTTAGAVNGATYDIELELLLTQ